MSDGEKPALNAAASAGFVVLLGSGLVEFVYILDDLDGGFVAPIVVVMRLVRIIIFHLLIIFRLPGVSEPLWLWYRVVSHGVPVIDPSRRTTERTLRLS